MPLLDLVTQVLLVVLGFALLFSGSALTRGLSLGTSPTWHELAFALPLAMLAYTGLETVANYAEEARQPGPRPAAQPLQRDRLRRARLRADRARRPLGVPGTARDDRARHRLAARADHGDRRGAPAARAALVRRTSCASTSASPARSSCSRPRRRRSPASAGSRTRSASTASSRARSAACTGARSSRRPPSSQRRGSRSACSIGTSFLTNEVTFLASLFSFGVLLAFTAAQLAVIKLRVDGAGAARGRSACRSAIRVRGATVPLPSVARRARDARRSSSSRWSTHIGARYGGPCLAARRRRRLPARPPQPRRRAARARRRGAASRSCPRRSSRRSSCR